jgi:NAD(P)-dependent dehydrogenase (short-subunit alcohol dehydrogenase family)
MKKTILITGATGKLGQHIAKILARAGYEIIINYRKNETAAKQLARRLASIPSPRGRGTKGEGVRPIVIQADVTNPKEVTKLFKQAGRVDILINNVGDFIWKPLYQTSEQEFADVIDNNLFSAWYCIKAALPHMRKQKFGRIINFGSAGCDKITTRPMTTPYYIAKTGLLMLTKSLAKEEHKNGITINMISPGILPTSVVKTEGAPIMTFDDIAKAVLFLLNTKGSDITTGSNLKISGGWEPE